MLICPCCGDVRVSNLKQLISHIRLLHSDEPNFQIQCNLQGCKKTFKKFNVYRNHVYAFHDTVSLDEEPFMDSTVTPTTTPPPESLCHLDDDFTGMFVGCMCFV